MDIFIHQYPAISLQTAFVSGNVKKYEQVVPANKQGKLAARSNHYLIKSNFVKVRTPCKIT